MSVSYSFELVWSEDNPSPVAYIVNGRTMSPVEFYSGDFERLATLGYNQQLLEDLFITITLLRAKILSKHCHY